jgi:hypothetical protein
MKTAFSVVKNWEIKKLALGMKYFDMQKLLNPKTACNWLVD